MNKKQGAVMSAIKEPQKSTDNESGNDLRENIEFIQMGIAALKGIGAMLQPEIHDQQLNLAKSSDASAIFAFIGRAMEGPANQAYNAMEELTGALEGVGA